MRRGLLVGVFGILLLLVPLAAHRLIDPNDQSTTSPSPSSQELQSFGTATTAVTVDVVVRDKRHKPITDLRREDFQLTEDGVRQEIAEMQMVAGPASTPPDANVGARTETTAGTADDRAPRGVTNPTFVALVFDELTTEGRYYANKAAEAYLETQHDDDFAGVFVTGASLVTVTPYTNDRRILTAALRKVAGKAMTPLQDPSAAGAGEAVTPAAGPPASASSGGFVSAAANGIGLAQRAQALWQMERLGRGFATADGLRAIVGALSSMPGRKTVVFFADNLSMPEEAMPRFTGMVAAANRANVAIYTVDVAGLRAVSQQARAANAVNAVGQAALDVDEQGASRNSIRAMENMERALREIPHVSLTLLSRDTGGFLIDDTNDLADGFRRIDADRRFHYVLTYTPGNADYNGEWRTIAVTIPSRPDVVIRARSGYVAVRAPGAIPLLTYEGRAIADLGRQPPPGDLSIRAAALVFPRPTGDSRVAILADTVMSDLSFEETGDRYRSDFTLLARLRDSHGDVVRKASRPYRLSGRIADKATVQAGRVLFFRQATLPAGQYTLDVVVDDALARKAGVARLPVTVPAAATGPRVSSLVLVARAQKVTRDTTEAGEDNELVVEGVQLYPNLGQPYRSTDTMSFYAAVLPGDAPVAATLGIARAETTLATQALPLPAVDASGRIRITGRIPMTALEPGDYTLVLTVTGGPMPLLRRTPFTVVR